MSITQPTAEDAVAEPELAGNGGAYQEKEGNRKRNAFSELMDSSKRPKSTPAKVDKASDKTAVASTPAFGKGGLGPYIRDPSQFTSREVIYFDDDVVAIRDAFPKATVHALLLPRDKEKSLLHPFDAFEDQDFLASVKAQATRLQKAVASELRHCLGRFSASERPRTEARDAPEPPDELPPGRAWEKEIITGVHAGPSMGHLHVHVLSIDHFSERMKHRKHYNSFKTPFFVRLDEFPLAKDDPRRQPNRGGHLRDDMICWRCGRNFGNKFAQLKSHLDTEFEEWKRE